MNRGCLMHRVLRIALGVAALSTLALSLAMPAQAQYACQAELGDKAGERPLDNPCPQAGDLVLPMPGGKLFMVFRAVNVPGGEFWYNPDRQILLGDPNTRIFEGRRTASVAGSFPARDGKSWAIYLGKYEVSLAQFATVYGEGDIDKGLRAMLALAGEDAYFAGLVNGSPDEAEKRRLLVAPVRGMRPRDYQEFGERYTDWCYATRACRMLLPTYGEAPGFFRLPTEIEWEYAAREGGGAEQGGLPFPQADAGDYAFVSSSSRVRERPTSIGRQKPTRFGLYDMFGNVDELADGRFYTEIGQGKAGMYTARGGSYANAPRDLRPSMRSEVQAYRRTDGGGMAPLRSERLGLRLAIGSQVVADPKTFAQVEKSYADYRSGARLATPAALSTRADLLSAADPLKRIDDVVKAMAERSPDEAASLQRILQETQEARVALERTTDSLAGQLSRNAIRDSAEAGRSIAALKRIEGLLASARAPGAADSIKAQVPRLEKQYAANEKAAEMSMSIYVDGVQRLASYGDFAEAALNRIEAQGLTGLDSVSFRLIRKHLADYRDGGADLESWKVEIRDTFSDPRLFQE